jgi:hypothetical protein
MLLGIGALFFYLRSYFEKGSQQYAPPLLLEIAPKGDNKATSEKQKQLLKSYGWLDRQKGLAHIPIDKAIEIMSHEY